MKKETKVASQKKTTRKVATQNQPKMISYAIKMVIPTGQYSNIQPEIVVSAGTPEEAHSYIAPHMNKLWKEYYMISEKKQEVVAPKANTPAPAQPEVSAPVSDVALVKATQAIQSCLSTDALDLIIKQIGVSVKLTEENKKSLLPLIEAKSKELNEKN